MTNATDPKIDQSDLNVDLATAFATAASKSQDQQSKAQESKEGVDNLDSSRTLDGTSDSRTDGDESTDDPLAKYTLEELIAHPTLGKLIQSHTDTVAAGQMKGQRARIEQEVEARLRSSMEMEIATQHFSSLSRDELAEELLDPNAARLYARVINQPTTNPEVDAAVQYYSRILNTYTTRLNDSGLDAKTIAELDPNKHLTGGGDADALMDSWTSKVDEAVNAAKVAKAVAEATKSDSKAKELEDQAKTDAGSGAGALTSGGRRVPPVPGIMEYSSGSAALADAFTRQAAQRKVN